MGSPEELRGFNDVLSHRHTANPDTPKESTRARGDFKSMFLQKELAKFVHTAPKYPKNTWAWLALPGKGLYRPSQETLKHPGPLFLCAVIRKRSPLKLTRRPSHRLGKNVVSLSARRILDLHPGLRCVTEGIKVYW